MPPGSVKAGLSLPFFPRWALGALALVITGLPAAGCSHRPRAEPGRPPLPLPPEVAEPYRPRHPGFGLSYEPGDDQGRYHRSYRFAFAGFSEVEGDFRRVEGRLYQTLRAPPGGRSPLLQVSPILAGAVTDYLECRVFSRWACEHGISTFFLHQEEDILAPGRDAIDLERRVRESIQDNIRALDLFLERPDVDPERLGTLGISLGAIKNAVLFAVEPRFSGNVVCLGGADLPRILRESRERRVLLYVRAREEAESLSREDLARELERDFRAEPARFAGAVANDRVLLILGSLDDKVPYGTGLLLREKLGAPETYVIPLGHYTGILAAPFAARKGFAYLRERFETARAPAEGPPAAPGEPPDGSPAAASSP
jgi:hypothetical protein